MSTLLRTSNVSSKLIFGCYQNCAIPQYPAPNSKKAVIKDSSANFITANSLQRHVYRQVNALTPFSGFSLSKGINVTSCRFVSSDVTFPNFDKYRPEISKDPTVPGRETADERKGSNAVFFGVGGMMAMLCAREVIQTIVVYKSMSRDQIALGSIEIDLTQIPEGTTKVYEWRGKPVFVRHRTQREIERERSVEVDKLRHPESDGERVKKAEWAVLIGICTHLGCVPIPGAGDFGTAGYFCPCHGSQYDGSGRIRGGPAPVNLHVPDYTFVNDNTIVVGSSQ